MDATAITMTSLKMTKWRQGRDPSHPAPRVAADLAARARAPLPHRVWQRPTMSKVLVYSVHALLCEVARIWCVRLRCGTWFWESRLAETARPTTTAAPITERGGSSLEHEPPPQCCYRMIAFTSSRTCSASQRLGRQQNRSRIGICRLDP